MKDNCFTEFCCFLSNLNLNQPYTAPLILPGEFHGQRLQSPWGHKESDTTEQLKLNLKYTIPSSSEFLLLPSQPAWRPCHLSYLLRSSPSPPSHFLLCTMWAWLPPFVLLSSSSLYTRSYILSYLYITPSVSSTQYLEFTEHLLIAFFADQNVDNYYLSEKRKI